MATAMFRDNPAYARCVRLLIDLHLLMKEGKDETAEGDQLRDEMDKCWPALSEAEVERINELSADLYTLEPDSPIQHPEEGWIHSEEARRTLKTLSDEGAWEKLLEFLRSNPSQVSAGLAAFQRGRCWRGLGEAEAALLFFRFAADKQDVFAPFLAIPLIMTGYEDEAALRLKDLLASLEKQPVVNVFLLADACCKLAIKSKPDDQREWLLRAIEVFETGFKKIEPAEAQLHDVEWMVFSYVNLAWCHHMLGNQQAALRACEEALRLNPDESYALILHGLILGGWPATAENPGESIRDVQRGFFSGALTRQLPSLLSLEFVA